MNNGGTSPISALIGSRNRFACYDGWVSARKFYVPEELALISRLTSREGQVSCRFLPPGYCVVSLDHQAGQGPPGAF